jgi:hypothetical protein
MPIIQECSKETPNAFEVKKYGGDVTFAVKTFEGRVLCEYEKNGYNDSDFFAVVWNDETDSIKVIEYGSTRHGGYYGCSIDATPETIAKAKEWKANVLAAEKFEKDLLISGLAEKGKLATVANAKGKNARFNGMQGVVFWEGVDKFAPHYLAKYGANRRVGLEFDGEKAFFSGEEVHVNNHEKNYHDIKRALRISANVAGYNPIYRLNF